MKAAANLVGTDNMFTGGETSSSRNLKFSNPNNEPFTVTFSVLGVLALEAPVAEVVAAQAEQSSSNTTGTSSSGNTTPLTNALLSITYNPLLNTVTWQVLKQ